VKETDYQLIVEHFYKLAAEDILRRCVLENEIQMILSNVHEGVAGGHYVGKEKTKKILRTDYGGIPFTKMIRNYVILVMFVRD